MKELFCGFKGLFQDLFSSELKGIREQINFLEDKIVSNEKRIYETRDENNRKLEEIVRRLEIIFQEITKRFDILSNDLSNFYDINSKRHEEIHHDINDLKCGQKDIVSSVDADKRINKIEAQLELLLSKKNE